MIAISQQPKTRLNAWHKVSHGGSITKQFTGGITSASNKSHEFIVMVSAKPRFDKKKPYEFFALFYSELYQSGITIDITAKQVLSFVKRNFQRNKFK